MYSNLSMLRVAIAIVGLVVASFARASDQELPPTFKSDVDADHAASNTRTPLRAGLVETCNPNGGKDVLCNDPASIADPASQGLGASPEEINTRGYVLLTQGQLDRAIEAFGSAIRLKPGYVEAFNNRGSAYFSKREYSRALADYEEAIRLRPTFAPALFNRGQVHKAMGEYERAIDDYAFYLRLKPDDPDALINRALAYRRISEYDQAIKDLDLAIRIRPDEAGALNARCWTRAIAGTDLTAAISDCTASLRLRPNYRDTLDSRALVYFRLGQYDLSIADDNAALGLNSKSASCLYVRGLARIRKGDANGGATDIAAAKALEPNIDVVYAGYGVVP